MKAAMVATVLGVVLIVIVVGAVVFRPEPTQAPTPTPKPQFEDVSGDGVLDVDEIFSEPSEEAEESAESDDAAVFESTTSTSPNTDTSVPASTVTVSIDETGFSPANITVPVGTTVTFINNGQAEHWPASDVHPTHEILPEFDSNKGLATGETYSFTFTQAGTWSMHDHLLPRSTGTIIVQ